MVNSVAAAAVVGAVAGYLATGTARGAALGAISGMASFGIGEAFGSTQAFSTELFQKSVMHGASQGAISHAGGGEFRDGFLGGFAGSYGGTVAQGAFDSSTAQLAASAVAGGTASRVGGGSFTNGAVSAAFAYAVGRAAANETAESGWTSEDAAHAGASQLAYEEEGGLLSLYGITYDSSDGLGAYLTIGPDGNYILGFRGTGAPGDWRANIGQALFGKSVQYDQAVDLAIEVHQATGGNVTFAGHSLGGGLASAAAYATGGRAITFNAAGLHSSYRAGAHSGIRAHYIRGDALTTVQRLTPLPNAAGTAIPHSGSGGPFRRHALSNFP